MQNFKKLFFLLSPSERKRGGLLLIMIFIMALLDMLGVASILPFMSVLTNPSLIETNLILNYMFKASSIFKIENDQQFIFALGVAVFILLIVSLTFKALTTYVQVQFVLMREHSIAKRLVEGYLKQPYSWFLSRNSADLGKNILSEVSTIINSGLNPIIELISRSMVTITLVTLLILVDTKLALMVGLSLTVLYGIIFYFIKNILNRIGKKRLMNNQLRFTAVMEAFGAVKVVKLGGLEQAYIKLFSNSAKIFAQTQATAKVLAQLPRFILEAIAFGGVLLMMLYIISQTGGFNSAIPILSLYVFAGYRLMPALQSIYNSFTSLTFVSPSLNKLYDDLKNLNSFTENQHLGILSLSKTINLKNIFYNYPDASRSIFKDVTISIPAKSSVGFIGATGSGKTTMADIILGLLEPQKGTLEVDGEVITKENVRSWQRSIGYVPQHIYLSDDTIAANIAFGVEPNDINQNLVERASKIANLHEFVINELPRQYQTTVGERGVRLSGGQRQRIGIARALYHNPQILILDEATSALDNNTEKVVMEALNNLGKDTTVILIAHRLNTVKNCDIIFKFEKGKVINQGKLNEITELN